MAALRAISFLISVKLLSGVCFRFGDIGADFKLACGDFLILKTVRVQILGGARDGGFISNKADIAIGFVMLNYKPLDVFQEVQ